MYLCINQNLKTMNNEEQIKSLQKECKKLIDLRVKMAKYLDLKVADPSGQIHYLEIRELERELWWEVMPELDRERVRKARDLGNDYTRMYVAEQLQSECETFMAKMLINDVITRLYHMEEASCGCL